MNHEDKAYYLGMAYDQAVNSPDVSNQVGAVILTLDDRVIGACNKFPPGVKHTDERATTRPEKYNYYAHAERSSIFKCADLGTSTRGAIMFSPWSPCCDCARGIILSGISKLVVHYQRMALTPDRWTGDFIKSFSMLDEAGVEVEKLFGPVDGPSVIVNGRLWSPKTLEFADGV